MNKSKDQLENEFIISGEREKIKDFLLQRLRYEGWVEEIKLLARKEIKEQGIKDINLDTLYEKLKAPARKLVANSTKQELFQLVRDWVAKETGVTDI